MGGWGLVTIVEKVKAWAVHERKVNPDMKLIVGRKIFTIDDIVRHIELGTDDGIMLLGMIERAGGWP